MFSDSRKARNNSFAHHRAHLLFATLRPQAQDGSPVSMGMPQLPQPAAALITLRQRVSAGILGFMPSADTSHLGALPA